MSRELIISIAKSQLGITENPPGSNKQKFGRWFGYDGAEWCGIFCSWVYDLAGHPIGHPVYKTDFTKGFASVPFALNLWRDKITATPQPGDLVLYDWNKDGQPDHVGLFVGWLDKSAGLFETIEGNTSTTNNSNGGQVQKRQRNMACVECFINLLG